LDKLNLESNLEGEINDRKLLTKELSLLAEELSKADEPELCILDDW